MNISKIYKTLEGLQPTLTGMQTLYNNEAMQRMIKTHRTLQANLSLPTQILKQIQQPLLSKEITQSLARLPSLHDIVGKNTLFSMSSSISKILKHNKSILGIGSILKSFDFKYTLGINSIVNTQFKEITQTFYGLQFSTTITKGDKNETHAQCNITITQAEYTEIRSERDYYKEKAFYWKEECQKIEQEKLELQYTIQTHSNTQSFKQNLSIQNSKNAKKKEHTELKNLILEIANNNSTALSTSTRSKKARVIEKIITGKRNQYNEVIQSQILKVSVLYNYINETLKKQV